MTAMPLGDKYGVMSWSPQWLSGYERTAMRPIDRHIEITLNTTDFQAQVDAVEVEVKRLEALAERSDVAMERLGTAALRAAAKRGVVEDGA